MRYCGEYLSEGGGAREANGIPTGLTAAGAVDTEDLGEYASRAKLIWTRLTRKVYEAYRHTCTACMGPVRMIALIEDPAVVQATLRHQRLWRPVAHGLACVIKGSACKIPCNGDCATLKSPEERS